MKVKVSLSKLQVGGQDINKKLLGFFANVYISGLIHRFFLRRTQMPNRKIHKTCD